MSLLSVIARAEWRAIVRRRGYVLLLSVFAALRGSLFAVGDEALLEYRHVYGHLRPFKIPEDVPSHLRPVVESLRLLWKLHRRRNHR